MDSNLLTVAQVAEKLGVNKQMVYELIKDGLLKSIRLGYKTIRVAPDDLKQFLEQQKDSNLLTVAQVAEKLSVNKQMVYELIKDGLLKSVRLGYKTIRVAPDDLKQFLEQQKEKKD